MRNVWTIARRVQPVLHQPGRLRGRLRHLADPRHHVCPDHPRLQSERFNGGFSNPGSAPDISGITGTFTFLLVLSVPALTMRLIADENRMGTMELLLTAPVRDWELIVGKWLGGFLFILTIIAVTLIYPLILNLLESAGD